MSQPAPRHVFLVDGSGFIFRAYHALPPLTRPDGTPVGAVYGFVTMLMKLLAETDADHIAVVFDSDRRTFRNDIYPEYKATRPDPPEDLIPQFELVREATRAFNVAMVEQHGYEADDLIATYARKAREAGARVTIVSSDKDLMQLVRDDVELFDAMKNRVIDAAAVKERFGVWPDKVKDVQALAGDSIDNVPGVPGIGVKTAAALIEEYGDLETLLAQAERIKQPKRRQSLIDHAEAARISRKLVSLDDAVDVPEPLAAFAVDNPDPAALRGFIEAQGFKSLLARIDAVIARSRGQADAGTPAVTGEDHRKDYEPVQDEAALARWIEEATRQGWVAIDTETTSLRARRADLVGVSLALAPGRACYIPLAHKRMASGELDLSDASGEAPRQIPLARALELLKPMLEDPSVLKIGHNIKYDLHVLAGCGIQVAPIDDTMILSYVLEGGQHGHGMDEVAPLYLGIDTITYADVAGTGKSQLRFDQVPLDKALAYAAEDADVTWRLHAVLKPRLVQEGLVSVYETIERPLIPVLTAMEAAGIRVDAAALKDLSRDFQSRMDDLEAEIHRLAGHPFNVGSPKQLGEVLFQEMGLQGGKKGKTGAYATGADVLEQLAAEGHDLPARVLDWRQLAKLKSTYADALVGEIDPRTGRVHTSYSQAATSTGRLASADPNLQNIPIRTEEGRKIRRAFVADDGCVLLSADYSQIELRLLAHVADIGSLKQAFREGQDIHALTASQVFGVPMEGMDPAVRRKAKAINFGIIYGISAFGLARQLGIPRGEAGAYIDAYFERYPGIQDYMERTRVFAREHGFVSTLFGRRCHIQGLGDRNPSVRNFAERAAINAPIQGGAADIIKRAMVRIPKALQAEGLGARMLLQVHDELVFEVPEGEVEATRGVVVTVMEAAAHLSVPLVVDAGTGHNWAEAH
ncbi:MAG: DNA polymerase I [Rhodospirillales bacterium]|nr:MAG: DNA polymerase I [Rhodospirillales bacterium]